jgi:predicted nuclease of predicted toxin-antitoxin system
MKLLIDMNLSPFLAELLRNEGWETIHWCNVGNPKAPDNIILDWAVKNGYWVVTHDLDFGAILAATKANCPSVIQVRTQDVSPDHLKPILLAVLSQYGSYLESGALVSVNEVSSRIRILPLRKQ